MGLFEHECPGEVKIFSPYKIAAVGEHQRKEGRRLRSKRDRRKNSNSKNDSRDKKARKAGEERKRLKESAGSKMIMRKLV